MGPKKGRRVRKIEVHTDTHTEFKFGDTIQLLKYRGRRRGRQEKGRERQRNRGRKPGGRKA